MPISISVTINVGPAVGVTFPAFGLWNNDNGMAAYCHQSGGYFPITTIYNYHQLFSFTADWDLWTQIAQSPNYTPCVHIQISPAPGGATFNPNDWANNHTAQFNKLAQNIAALGSSVVSAAIGWEWNYNGACSIENGVYPGGGWDASSANRTLYITQWRNIAQAFKTYCPNVIRAWCMNHNQMTDGSDPSDWYPGDDVVDAVGMEFYTVYAGGPSGGGLGDYSWIDTFSAASRLGTGHPAKATGSMVINGVSTPIPHGAQNYIVIAESQDSPGVSVAQMLAWDFDPSRRNRLLVHVYWNNGEVGQYGGNQLQKNQANIKTVTFPLPNQEAIDWKSYLDNTTYPHPWPIPRLH